MEVPFLDLKAQLPEIRDAIEVRFRQIIDNTAFVCGKNVAEFEEKFAGLQNVKYCVGLSSGTDANHLAVLAAGVGPGDEVILPVNTFIATAEGISLASGTPVFVDVNPYTFNIDPVKVEQAITKRTKAIVVVHLYGQPANMNAIKALADKYHVRVIEDAAQAHCAEFNGQRVGGIGIASAWSFYPGKNLGAWGEAGALTTNDERIYQEVRKRRDHGSVMKYAHELIGHNYRMSEFQAAVLNEKLRLIEEWTARRIINAAHYTSMLKDVPQIQTPVEGHDLRHVYHLYVTRAQRRDKLQGYLAEQGIATGLHYPVPLHLTEAYQSLGYEAGDFPVAEKASKEILSLPMFPELTDAQIGYVCDHIQKFYAAVPADLVEA